LLLIDLVKKLRSTKSKKELVDIIKNNLTENSKVIIWYMYNPFIKFYITKVNPTKYGSFHLEDKMDKLTDLLDKLSQRIITGNNAKEVVNNVASMFTKEDVEILKCIFKKSLESGVSIKTINAAIGEDYIPYFEVQLANSYIDFISKKKSSKIDSFYESVKMNGVRGYWYFLNPNSINSRSGFAFSGFDHILIELNKLASKYNLSFIDGELFSSEIPFHEIQSIVMLEKEDSKKKKISLNIFAVGLQYKKMTTEEMVTLIAEMKKDNIFQYLDFVEYFEIENDYEKIKEACQEYVKYGQEGIMLRSKDVAYSYGRSDDLLKYKPIMDPNLINIHKQCELRIVDFKEGTGWCKNSLGSLKCAGNVNGEDVVTWCGSGFTEDERKEIWKNKDMYFSKEITLKYADITKNSKTNISSLEFPIKVEIKLDR